MSEEKTMVKLCGLWKSKTREGVTFYSGKLTYSSQLLVFKNKYKKEDDKNPDLIVYISEYKKKEKPAEAEEPDELFDEPAEGE
ncbi:hypothetical protein ES702_06744 [subsurface metagenome]